MYILPGYIKETREDDCLLVKSDLYNNIIKLSEKKYIEEYNNIKVKGCISAKSELEKFLIEQSILINENEIENELKSFRNLIEKKLMLTIMPTEDCNFCCPYCYEQHNHLRMDEHKKHSIMDFIASNINAVNIVQISWFGGEPTLCKKFILEVNKYVQKLVLGTETIYFSNMTTNGYLLNVSSFKEYFDSGISEYQITIDGFNHDNVRKLKDGSATLNKILYNIHNIASLPKDKYNYKIVLRYNILGGKQDFSWYDFLKKEIGDDERFLLYITKVGNWGGESVNELELLSDEDEKIVMSQHLSYIQKLQLRTTNGEHYFSKICYAALPWGFVFRPNGDIVKCTVALDHPLNKVGYIDNKKGVIIDDEKNDKWYKKELSKECKGCSSLLSCLNLSCPKRRIIDQKSHCSLRCETYDKLF